MPQSSISSRPHLAEPLESRRLLATFIVNTPADGPSNPVDGVLTLREAITASEAAAGADVIEFSPAAFNVPRTILLTEGALQVSGDLTINDSAAGVTVDAGGDSRVLAALSGADLTVNGLVLTNGATRIDDQGTADPSDDTRDSGGAVFIEAGDVVGGLATPQVRFNGTTISNSAGGDGGGIFSQGNLTLINATVTGNTAFDPDSGSSGGGIFASLGTLTIIGGTYSDNTSTRPDTSGAGGGIRTFVGASITGATITGNTSNFGGGVLSEGGDLLIANSILSNNAAEAFEADPGSAGLEGGSGGGLYVDVTNGGTIPVVVASASITGSTIGAVRNGAGSIVVPGNTAQFGAGAFFIGVEEDAPALIRGASRPPADSTNVTNAIDFTNATGAVRAERFGGAAVTRARFADRAADDADQPDVPTRARRLFGEPQYEVIESTFDANAATASGGGLFAWETTVNIAQSRFVANSVSGGFASGGGIGIIDADLFILNSELSQNVVFSPDSTNRPSFGGAIDLIATNPTGISELFVVNTTIANNTAGNRAALSASALDTDLVSGTFEVRLIQDTITGNTATFAGGGVVAQGGAGVSAGTSEVLFANTILAGNVAPDLSGNPSPSNLGQVNTGAVEFPITGVNIFGTDLIGSAQDISTDDPMLRPLGYYGDNLDGGNTRSMPPIGPASPAYNAGDDSVAVDPGADGEIGTADDEPLTVDQRAGDFPRIVYEAVDIGATEYTLIGDADRSGTVSLADFLILRANFGQEGRTFGQGNFNSVANPDRDTIGAVSLADFLLLRANFGTSVPLGPAPSPASLPLFGKGSDGDDDGDRRAIGILR